MEVWRFERAEKQSLGRCRASTWFDVCRNEWRIRLNAWSKSKLINFALCFSRVSCACQAVFQRRCCLKDIVGRVRTLLGTADDTVPSFTRSMIGRTVQLSWTSLDFHRKKKRLDLGFYEGDSPCLWRAQYCHHVRNSSTCSFVSRCSRGVVLFLVLEGINVA